MKRDNRKAPEAGATGLKHFLFLRSTFALLLVGMFITLGWMAWSKMVRENYPDLEIPMGIVTTEWPGASPDQIEKQISQEIEKVVRGLNGLKRVQSGSFDSYSVVTVEFHADEDSTESMNALRAKLDEAEAEFPAQAEKPKLEQVSVNDTPIVSYMLYGDLPVEIQQQTAKSLKKKLEQVPGVRKINIAGEREQTVYVRLYPDRLRSLKISPLKVRERIEAANLDGAWGAFESDEANSQLQFEGRFEDLTRLRQLDIKRISNDRIVRLGEIALVEVRPEKADVLTAFSSRGSGFQPGVGIDILKVSGGDTLAIIDSVCRKIELEQTLPTWPHGLEATITTNEGDYIHESFNDIFRNVWQAMLAVFAVLFVLLTWREATMAGLAIPLTLLATLGIQMFMGYTLNSMIIIGMVLALGMLVDVFILVMEGMHDGLYNKKLGFAGAAQRTVRLYARPALAGQVTTILALIPLLAVGGIDGKFIRMIPVTIIVCLLVSFIIAFLICVPLSRFALKQSHAAKQTRADRLFLYCGKKLRAWLLCVPLRGKKTAFFWLASPLVLLLFVLSAAGLLPVEMYPKDDGRKFGILLELGPNATLRQSEAVAESASAFLEDLPYLDNVSRYVGKKSALSLGAFSEALLPKESPNYVGFSAIFIPEDQRDKMGFEYVDEIRTGLESRLYKFAGVRILLSPDLGGASPEAPIQIVIKGSNIQTLMELSRQVQDKLRKIPGTTDVRDNIGPKRQQFSFRAIPEALSFYGLTEDELIRQIRTATAFDEIGKFRQYGVKDDFPIRLGTYWSSRGKSIGGPMYYDELENLQIILNDKTLVPLGSLVEYAFEQKPQVYVHTGGVRAVTVKARAEGRTALEILAQMTPQLDALKTHWPPGYHYVFLGEMEASSEAYGNMGIAFVAALLLVFTILTLIFGNFSQPFIVLVSVPMAMIGTFGGFFLAGIPLSFIAVIGLVSLVGIVVNNAIVMVETINLHRNQGVSAREAAANSASERLRPILGTTITTVAGLTPLALSSPLWFPLAMAIIYGLVFSTLISLVLVPTLYFLINREQKHVLPDSESQLAG